METVYGSSFQTNATGKSLRLSLVADCDGEEASAVWKRRTAGLHRVDISGAYPANILLCSSKHTQSATHVGARLQQALRLFSGREDLSSHKRGAIHTKRSVTPPTRFCAKPNQARLACISTVCLLYALVCRCLDTIPTFCIAYVVTSPPQQLQHPH